MFQNYLVNLNELNDAFGSLNFAINLILRILTTGFRLCFGHFKDFDFEILFDTF